MAKQISAPYIECSAQQSENSVRDIFHVATLACINKNNKNVKRSKVARGNKRISHMPGRPDLAAVASDLRKDKAKSCSVMWLIRRRKGTEHSASRKLGGSTPSVLHAKHPPFVWKGVLQASLDVHVTGILCTNTEKPMHSSIPIHMAPPEEEAIHHWATCSGKWPASSGRTERIRSRRSAPTGNEQEKWCHQEKLLCEGRV